MRCRVLLVEAKMAGFDVQGMEMSRPMAVYATDRWGVAVTAGSIEHEVLPAEASDVIASWGVLTLLQDPIAVMRRFHRALKPAGFGRSTPATMTASGIDCSAVDGDISASPSVSSLRDGNCSSFCARKVSSCLRGVATDRPHTDVLKFVDHLVMVTVGNRS
jgi:Methyltransferase domain